jgi:arylsulfatase A-like enzyme
MTSAMDDGIGKILARLKDLNLEQDTIVIFTSDNGCPIMSIRKATSR